MKLKLFTIGLLATLAMTSTTVEAAQRQRAQVQATQQVPVLQAQVAAGGAAHPNLNIGGGAGQHADNTAAVDDLHRKLGTHAGAAGGDTANHRIDALHATLGHAAAGGAANDPANKKVEDAVALIQPGQPLHTGITNTNTRLGVGYQTAGDAGAAIAAAVPPRGPNAIPNNLEIALNHPAAKAAGAAHAGNAVPDDSTAKATNLLARLNAGSAGVGDGANHAIVHKGNYPSIEAWITAQGW